jgi:hypothetical protein
MDSLHKLLKARKQKNQAEKSGGVWRMLAPESNVEKIRGHRWLFPRTSVLLHYLLISFRLIIFQSLTILDKR